MDVVLIVVDTLRSDGLGCGGAPARQSPELDALAARSAQFRTCVSQSPWTIPALGSIVTGHYPSTHGANWLSASLSESVPTLAERFRDAGWATAGIVSHYLAGERHGFARGFDHFDERNAAGHRHISSKILTDFALDWLDDQTGPSFLFVHYFDPHYDYRTHRGFTQTEAYGGAVEPGTDIWELRAAADDLDADDLAHLRELYAGEIRFMDHHVGRLLRSLRSRERDVVIAVTADHGEEFLEHGWLGHTRNLHGGLVRVPLLVHDSRRPEREVREDPAMLVDVHPTLLALAGLEVGEGPGRDLFRETGPRDLISEVEFGPRDSTPPEGDRETLDRERQLAKTAFQQAIQRDGVEGDPEPAGRLLESLRRRAGPGGDAGPLRGASGAPAGAGGAPPGMGTVGSSG